MTKSGGHPLHPDALALLDAFAPAAAGPELDAETFARWGRELGAHTRPRPLARDLIVLALRFRDRGAERAVAQLVWLASILVGALATEKLLASAGVASQEAKRLARTAQGVSPPLLGGLASPHSRKNR
jgi:hypothetical protein